MKQAVRGTRDGRGRWRGTKTENRRKRENGTAPFLLFRIKRASSSRVLFSIGRARAYYTRSRVPFSLSLSLSSLFFRKRRRRRSWLDVGNGEKLGCAATKQQRSFYRERGNRTRDETRRDEARREARRVGARVGGGRGGCNRIS